MDAGAALSADAAVREDGSATDAAVSEASAVMAGEFGSRTPTSGDAGEAAAGGSAGGTGGDSQGARPVEACEHPVVEEYCDGQMCTIPAGCFIMGAPRDALYAAARNDAQVEVRLTHSFLIGRTEVTRGQWFELGLPEPTVDWTRAGSSDPAVPMPEYGDPCTHPECPIVVVGFEDAIAYANVLSEAEDLPRCYDLQDCEGAPGEALRCHSVRVTAETPYLCQGYRLPTEAEWEYAVRAGTSTAFYSGEMDPSTWADCGIDTALDAIGWYCGNSGAPNGKSGLAPHPVAQKAPNGWGLFDMTGNAAEWVNDIYDPRGYGEGPLTDPVLGVQDPQDLTPAEHPVYGDNLDLEGYVRSRIVRGGAYESRPIFASSNRRIPHSRSGFVSEGLRVVRTLELSTRSNEP